MKKCPQNAHLLMMFSEYTLLKSFLVLFLGPKQEDCQENDGIDIANVGGRTTVICQNEKDDGKKQNGKKNNDQTITNNDFDIVNNIGKVEDPNVNIKTNTTTTSPQTSGM